MRKPTPSTTLTPCVTSTCGLVRRRTADQEELINVCTGRRLFDLRLHESREPRRLPAGPKATFGATRTVQPTPRPARDGPGEPTGRPRGAQERPRAAPERPRAALEGAKGTPGEPRSGQERPRSGPKAPRTLRGQKCAPGGPKMRPRRAQHRLQEGQKWASERTVSKTPTDVTAGRSGHKLNQTTDQLTHTTGSTQVIDLVRRRTAGQEVLIHVWTG